MKDHNPVPDVPVVLFVFKRHKQLKETLTCLRRNKIPLLYVFADGARTESELEDVRKVQDLIKNIGWTKTILFLQPKNKGLSKSIQDGLDIVFEKHDRAIIIEDDVCVSPDFYGYMAQSLAVYEDDHRIDGVTGLRYPFSQANLKNISSDVFLTPRFSSWGWGTWRRSWKNISFRLDDLKNISDERLNSGGVDIPDAITELRAGRLTGCWDVYFFMNMAKKGTYFIWPKYNMVKNNGLTEGSHADGAQLPPWTLEWEKRPNSPLLLPKKLETNATILKDFLSFFLPENLAPKQIESNTNALKGNEGYTPMKAVRSGLNKIAHKAGYHVTKLNSPTLSISEPPVLDTTADEPKEQILDPKDYSTTDDPQEVPCQKVAYYHALNNLITSDSKVLDVGSGLGYGMAIMSVNAKEVQGIDVDAKAVAHAKKEYVGNNPKIKNVQEYNGYDTPFKDNEFDVITCIDVLEHVEDYDRFIDELLRISKEYVLISTPNHRKEFTRPDGKPKNPWHLREWKPSELKEIVSKHAATVEWHYIDGPFDGPFKTSQIPSKDTLVLMPILRKKK